MEGAAASVLLPPAGNKVLILALLLLAAGSPARRVASGESLEKKRNASMSFWRIIKVLSIWFFELWLIRRFSWTNADGVRYDYRAYTEVRVRDLSICLSLVSLSTFSCLPLSVQTSSWACSVQWRHTAVGEQSNRLQDPWRRELLTSICAVQHVRGNRIQLLLWVNPLHVSPRSSARLFIVINLVEFWS